MKRLLVLSVLILSACGGEAGGLAVGDAIYRAPLVEGGVGVAYFSITSGVADNIVGVTSPEAVSVEIHASSESEDGRASMHRIAMVALPAGQSVTFGPGGLHLMVFGPRPLSPDATFPIQITLESGRQETISFRSVDGAH